MAIAVFGRKTFQVDANKIYTFNGLTYSSVLQTDAQGVDGQKPSTYIKGEGLDTLAISLPLEQQYGVNPRQEWNDWQTILSKKTPELFILGGVPIGKNKWLLKSVSPSDIKINNAGGITGLVLSLEFEEYVRPGKKEVSSSKSSSSGIKSKVNVQDQIAALVLTPDEKAAAKRTNPNMG